jgi:DNA-directed RNA polymerase specialized sigma24 family protein
MAGLSYEEIAGHLDIEASQVTKMLAEALVDIMSLTNPRLDQVSLAHADLTEARV